MKFLDVWFPCFRTYSDTVLGQLLPSPTSTAMERMVLLPEEAILEDIKRVVEATLVTVQSEAERVAKSTSGADS